MAAPLQLAGDGVNTTSDTTDTTIAAAEKAFGVTVSRGAAGEHLFRNNAWSPLEYARNGSRDLYITEFRLERCSAYNTLVKYVLLPVLGRVAYRLLTTEYLETFGPCAAGPSASTVGDPIVAYVDERRRFVENGSSFGGAFPGELVLQTFVEGSPESGFVYVFDGAIRGRVRVTCKLSPGCWLCPCGCS
mmetsp:Transcript_45445/g.146288  ORF Transcript_45445/g.146288 Transcript_45445/m.146288 type:complete len:189 (+) Transcript_45445:89-655(+)